MSMKVPKYIIDKLRRLHKLNCESSTLDLEIRNYLESKNLIDSNGDGINGFSLDSYIDIIDYGTGNVEEIIEHLKNL